MSLLDNSCPIKEKNEGITQLNSNTKLLNMLRRIVIIKFHVVIHRREWRQNKLKIFESTVKPKNKKWEAGGRKPLDLQLKNQTVEWT